MTLFCPLSTDTKRDVMIQCAQLLRDLIRFKLSSPDT